MGLIFEVAEGGFLDIDVKITGPDSKTIHEGSRYLMQCFGSGSIMI